MIIDAFTFYNEIDMLKLRLEYLDPFVDYFVIVESTLTHRGDPKELYFQNNTSEFEKWVDKIIHVIVKDNPEGADPWLRENHQRNCIIRGLDRFNDDDIVMISDVDEIPNVKAIQNNAQTYSLDMITFNYSLHFIQTFERWFGTVVTHKRDVIKHGAQYFRDRRSRFPALEFAGWHFTSFGDTSFVTNKLKNFAHCHEDGFDTEMTDKYISEGLSHNGKFKLTPTPQYILDTVPEIFKIKYQHKVTNVE
jgi:beta-1,4-mannosyl-glycoprotein beta-1,4-N-acetylglucosaminyltransferase